MNKTSKLIAEIKEQIKLRKIVKEYKKETKRMRRAEDPLDYYFERFVLVIVPLFFSTIIFISCGYRFYFNEAIPTGIYKVSDEKPQKMDLVVLSLCPCNDYFPLKDRAYTRKRFLLYVAAHTGDKIDISPDGICINAALWANSKIMEEDSQKRKMFSLLTAGVIPEGKALVLSKEDKSSFDSRYFGLVPVHVLKK